jgi:signal transduction histidine kinase
LLKKKTEMEMQEFDLTDVVDTTLHILSPEATKRLVILNAHHVNVALSVRADPIHLQQVILNLAMNGMDAIQNSTSGARKLTFQTVLTSDNEVEVSVADSGTGVPKDKLTKIFDTFYTTKGQGTGLGLSIARTIVETYGGRIWAENLPAGGAVFRFTVPLVTQPVAA